MFSSDKDGEMLFPPNPAASFTDSQRLCEEMNNNSAKCGGRNIQGSGCGAVTLQVWGLGPEGQGWVRTGSRNGGTWHLSLTHQGQ